MPSTVSTASDTDELAHFREKWKEEIRGRAQQAQLPTPSSTTNSEKQPVATASNSPRSRLASALESYALAVSREQSGSHPEATRLYRNAFRLDPNVDKAYHREEIARRRQLDPLSSVPLPHSPPVPSFNKAIAPTSGKVIPTGKTLAALLESWPQVLLFVPENEACGVPMNRLPDELVIYILSSFALHTDAMSIERFATVSKRARVLTLDSTIWRQMVEATMVPMQLADSAMSLKVVAEKYRLDYRRVYIEHPRIRLDGVYISTCHYVRNGLAESPWVTISHLITYRRFLRFLSNGEVLSYRANEDQDIVDVVHTLQPGLQRKDLCIGNWQLMGTAVLVKNLIDERLGGNYSFQMYLTLKSRPSLGRWNKLEFDDYESINLETSEISHLSLRHERPYWFSKVRSY